MSAVSKSVAISPPAATAAGCTAQCPGVQTDYPDGWAREYTLSASAASGWQFVKFTWSKVRRTASGTTPIGDYESSSNPSTAADGLAEARIYGDKTYWQEDLIENIVAYFEQAPATYTITTAVSPAGSGTATGDGTYTSGASCTLTATPESGYSFVRWEKNGVQVSTSSSYTFTVSESATYTAIFESATPLVHIQVVAFNGFYVTLNGTHGTTSGAWTVAEGDFTPGDTITITASAPNPTITPFKAWYLNPSAWGSPEQTGTLVSGAGATYTFTATTSATYFATFNAFAIINIRTEYEDLGTGEAPDAVVSINGQSSGGNRFNLQVALGSPATVGTTEYGGAINHPFLGTCRLYFMGWIDRAADPSSSAIISTALQYAFQATQSYGYDFIASYRPFLKLTTATMPNAACGSISTSPTGRDGEWFEAWTGVTLTATPSSGYRFVKWTAWESLPGGREYEYDISTNAQISIEVQDYDGKTIRAYFEWDGTGLLVNSANLGSPVKLVYDPATNLLVADY